VKPDRERLQAEGMLRLLLEDADPAETVRRIGWERLAPLARRHGVLLRVADQLASAGHIGPISFRDAVQQERDRVRSSLSLIERVSWACEKHGVGFLFPKAFQHLPDIGNDLDLLIVSDDPPADTELFRAAGIRARRRARNGLTRATSYETDCCDSLLDVQHGRLGRMGEDAGFARIILAGARRRIIEGMEVRVLSPEHQLLLQGMQRIFGRADVRLSDLVYTITSLRRDRLDWGQILETAATFQILAGLACYLTYVDQVQREVLAGPPLELPAALRADPHRWGRLEFRGSSYRFPAVRVNGALYVAKLRADVREHNWAGAGRLCLAPAVAAASLTRRVLNLAVRYVGPRDEPRPLAARHLNSLS